MNRYGLMSKTATDIAAPAPTPNAIPQQTTPSAVLPQTSAPAAPPAGEPQAVGQSQPVAGVTAEVTQNQYGAFFLVLGGNTYALNKALPLGRTGMGFNWFGTKKTWSKKLELITPEDISKLEGVGVDLSVLQRPEYAKMVGAKQNQPTVDPNAPRNPAEEKIQQFRDAIAKAVGDGGGSEKVKAITAHVEKTLEQLALSTDHAAQEGFVKAFLVFASKFWQYSFHNQMLIFTQKPSATYCRGPRQWEKMGRRVVNPQNGIAILSPRFAKDKGQAQTDDETTADSGDAPPPTPQPKGQKGQMQLTSKKPSRPMYFAPVEVFDISDTEVIPGWKDPETGAGPFEGKPPVRSDSNEDNEHIDTLVHAALNFAKDKGLNVDLDKELPPDLGGYSQDEKVVVNKDFRGINQFSTLVHELAHAFLHQFDNSTIQNSELESLGQYLKTAGFGDRVYNDLMANMGVKFKTERTMVEYVTRAYNRDVAMAVIRWYKQKREIEAESTAFIVLNHFGLETKDAPNYLALWRATGEKVKSRRDGIVKACQAIIQGIESEMHEVPQSPAGVGDPGAIPQGAQPMQPTASGNWYRRLKAMLDAKAVSYNTNFSNWFNSSTGNGSGSLPQNEDDKKRSKRQNVGNSAFEDKDDDDDDDDGGGRGNVEASGPIDKGPKIGGPSFVLEIQSSSRYNRLSKLSQVFQRTQRGDGYTIRGVNPQMEGLLRQVGLSSFQGKHGPTWHVFHDALGRSVNNPNHYDHWTQLKQMGLDPSTVGHNLPNRPAAPPQGVPGQQPQVAQPRGPGEQIVAGGFKVSEKGNIYVKGPPEEAVPHLRALGMNNGWNRAPDTYFGKPADFQRNFGLPGNAPAVQALKQLGFDPAALLQAMGIAAPQQPQQPTEEANQYGAGNLIISPNGLAIMLGRDLRNNPQAVQAAREFGFYINTHSMSGALVMGKNQLVEKFYPKGGNPVSPVDIASAKHLKDQFGIDPIAMADWLVQNGKAKITGPQKKARSSIPADGAQPQQPQQQKGFNDPTNVNEGVRAWQLFHFKDKPNRFVAVGRIDSDDISEDNVKIVENLNGALVPQVTARMNAATLLQPYKGEQGTISGRTAQEVLEKAPQAQPEQEQDKGLDNQFSLATSKSNPQAIFVVSQMGQQYVLKAVKPLTKGVKVPQGMGDQMADMSSFSQQFNWVPALSTGEPIRFDSADDANRYAQSFLLEASGQYAELRKKYVLGPDKLTKEGKKIDDRFAMMSAGLGKEDPSHQMINALAGTGKTTSLASLAWKFGKPGQKWLYLVFNRANKNEALERFPAWVEVKTTNGFMGQFASKSTSAGLLPTDRLARGSQVTDKAPLLLEAPQPRKNGGPSFPVMFKQSVFPQARAYQMDDDTLRSMCDQMGIRFGAISGAKWIASAMIRGIRDVIVEIVNKSKACAIDPYGSNDNATREAMMANVVKEYGVTQELDDKVADFLKRGNELRPAITLASAALGVPDVLDYIGSHEYLPAAVTIAHEVMKDSLPGNSNAQYTYNYGPQKGKTVDLGKVRGLDDDLWLPAIRNDHVQWPKYDFVMADEVQDFNKCQATMLQMLSKAGARIVAVGDPNQCQPAGTLVSMTGGTRKPIEEIVVGDQVVTYNSKKSYFPGTASQGRKVTAVGMRHFDGDMIRISAGEFSHECTPNHKCLVRLTSGKFWGLYLMIKGQNARVGICRLQYQNGFGLTIRAVQERADKAWLLGAYESEAEARFQEMLVAYEFNLPEVIFTNRGQLSPSQSTIDRFYDRVGFNLDKAERCLVSFGRSVEYPIWTREQMERHGQLKQNYVGSKKSFVTHACNLITGFMQVRTFDGTNRGGEWKDIEVSRKTASTEVYSLEVEPTEDGRRLYIANGIVTHNCVYRFRGADADAFNNVGRILMEQSKQKDVMNGLTLNFRCDENILDYVNGATECMKALPPEKQLKTGKKPSEDGQKKGMVTSGVFDEGDMVHHLLEDVQQAKNGVAPMRTTAILCRTRSPLAEAAMALLANGVPFTLAGTDFSKDMIQTLNDALRTESSVRRKNGMLQKGQKLTLADLSTTPDQTGHSPLSTAMGHYHAEEIEPLANMNQYKSLYKERVEKYNAVMSCLEQYAEFNEQNQQQGHGEGFVAWLQDNLKSIDTESEEGAEALKQKREAEKNNPVKTVILSTSHKSKGLEFGNVYVMRPDLFPHPKSKMEKDIAAEDKLKYVTFTRAEKELHVLQPVPKDAPSPLFRKPEEQAQRPNRIRQNGIWTPANAGMAQNGQQAAPAAPQGVPQPQAPVPPVQPEQPGVDRGIRF